MPDDNFSPPAGVSGHLTEPDLVEGGGQSVSRRTTAVAGVVVVSVLAVIAWRLSVGTGSDDPSPQATGDSVAQPAHPATPEASRPTVVVSPSSASGEDRARLKAWLDTLPRRANRPSMYGDISASGFRIVHSGGFTGAEDYGAVAQLRDAAGRWVDVANGQVSGSPPRDGSGRFLAFTVSKVGIARPRVRNWVYVVAFADARVVRSLRVDSSRYVAGWLGDRVIVASYANGVAVRLLDWQRATPVFEDLGPGSVVVRDKAGEVNLIHAEAGCLSVWRFARDPHSQDVCPDDQILAMSPDGRDAITHDLSWVRLGSGSTLGVGDRPYGVVARSASFLANGSALVDVTLNGTHVEATLLCSRAAGCRRVPTRRQALRPR